MKKYYFLFGLIFFAFINFSLAQDFDVPLTVTDDNHSITLWFGVDPLGTDGFDVGLDTLAPPPPPGGFDARFNMPPNDFLTDIRDNLITEKQFHLEYQPELGDEPIVLHWDSSHLDSLGTFSIVDDITGTLFGPVDMTTIDSLVVTNPLILAGLRILVTPFPKVSNLPPELDPITDQNMDEGETLPVPVSATDPDGDNIALSSPNLPSFGNLVDNGNGTGTITFTPDFTQSGVYPDIMVIATDDGVPSLADTVTFTLTVDNVNRAPALDPITDQNMDEGETLPVPVNSTDPDGDNIALSSPNLPSFGNLVDNGNGTGTITFTPGVGDSGVYPDIEVIATDDGSPSLADTTLFTLTVGIELISDPSNLTADASVENEVELNWTDNSDNEDGFIIEREIPTLDAFVVIDTVGTNVSTYTDASVLDGERYNYRVKAYNAFTQSSYSNTVQVVTILPAPSNLSAQVFETPWRVVLNWTDNSDNELGFVLVRDSAGTGFVDYQTIGANITAYTDFLVTPIETYIYKMYAFTDDTVSEDSDTAGVIVPVELSSFTASLSGTSVTILWTTATELNNQGFELERMIDKVWEKIAFIEGNGTTTKESNYQYIDEFKYNSVSGIVQYRLKQIDYDGTYEYSDVVEVDVDFKPREYVLFQNYPNPFNPSTKIKYALPQSSKVNLTVYNAIGEAVMVLADEVQDEGFHEIDFEASNLPSGIYLYRLVANENIQVKKMILLK